MICMIVGADLLLKNINLCKEKTSMWINQLFSIIITTVESINICKVLMLKPNANLPKTITNKANYIQKHLQI